ncbi:MAG: Sec-independent protein translocase TatA [Rhodobacterales bacterium 32-66-7]|nr:MAG: Sec-independent protein translocase TatA [Rhodobacterales bacterium 32-66-7]
MSQIGPWSFLLIAIVVLVLFGKGKIAGMMGELGKGITAFKRGVSDGTKELDDAKVEAARDVTPSDKDKV